LTVRQTVCPGLLCNNYIRCQLLPWSRQFFTFCVIVNSFNKLVPCVCLYYCGLIKYFYISLHCVLNQIDFFCWALFLAVDMSTSM